MANLPVWTPLVLIVAIAVHGADYFFCDSQLADTNNGPIGFFKDFQAHMAFTGCTKDPQTGQASGSLAPWFILLLFVAGTVPILMLLYVMIAPLIAGLLSNSIAGSVAAIVGFAALIVFFGILIATS
jgi:hypothetical protein